MKTKVGETVRLFVGNGGPNLVSSFHVIGEIFDKVHVEGGSTVIENIQTTLIPAGGASITEFKVDVPGTLILVDHSIFRAFNKGAIGMLEVEGEENEAIYSGKVKELVYKGEGSTIQTLPDDRKPVSPVAKNLDERMKLGEIVYKRNCLACHQAEGQGVKKAFPPLAKSDFMTNPEVVISAVIHGLEGEITVNGEVYNGVMPVLGLDDEEVANVTTYVMNSWGNKGKEVTPKDVQKLR